jgi:sulfur relay (sulfurtransferase) complex TusBCD TusD component (DsrE family)
MTVPDSDTVIQITRFGMGHAEPELQIRLLQTYLSLLDEHAILPAAVTLYTDGVKLAVSGSPVLEQLKSLEKKGVRLILCSTCLNYFGLYDQIEVGIVGGMTDILEAQRLAGKVVTL